MNRKQFKKEYDGKPENRSLSGLTLQDPTGDNQVEYLVGSRGLTVSLFARDRNATWHYVGLYHDTEQGLQFIAA